MMSDKEEPSVSAQESAIAVALTGAFLGVYLLDNLVTAAILAALGAYATTTDSQAGDIASSTGARPRSGWRGWRGGAHNAEGGRARSVCRICEAV
jgi:hypothetical protein